MLVVAIGFSTELWGRGSDIPIYLWSAVVVLYGGLTLASVAGLTARPLNVTTVTGTVSDLVVYPSARDFVLRGYPKSGFTTGQMTFRVGNEPIMMRGLATLTNGDAVVAAGIKGQSFEILALGTHHGIATLPEPVVPLDRPGRELALGLASLLLFIGFYICFRVQQLHSLTHAWKQAIARARALVAAVPMQPASRQLPKW